MDENTEDLDVCDEPINSQKDMFADCSPADISMENYASSTVIDMEGM